MAAAAAAAAAASALRSHTAPAESDSTSVAAEELPAPCDGSELWWPYGAGVESSPFYVILFYKYVTIEDPVEEASLQRAKCRELGLTGRQLVASEGINATLCGTPANVQRYVAWMRSREDTLFADVDWKGSCSETDCFSDLHCRVVKEIISTGNTVKAPHVEGAEPEGEELRPEDFHDRLAGELRSGGEEGKASEGEASGGKGAEPDWLLLDCRNENESAVGTFQGALRVPMKAFTEFPRWTEQNSDLIEGKRVLMFCTGGIRCRKGSAIVKKLAKPADVVQLKGGIHRYLETFPEGGLWQGRNFVFDKRQSLPPPAVDRPLGTACGEGGGDHCAAAASSSSAGEGGEGEGGGQCAIFGRCHVCSSPWEEFSGRDVCQVCRFLLLVCPTCRRASRGLLYCKDHAHFEGSYLWWLGDSTAEELREQRRELSELHEAVAQGRRLKNKRRTIRRQIERIDARLESLASGEAEAEPRAPRHPCRSCGEASCDGDCWGFWASKVDDRRAQGKLRARDELYVREAQAAAAAAAADEHEDDQDQDQDQDQGAE